MKKFKKPKFDIYELSDTDVVTLSPGDIIDPDDGEPTTPIIPS